MHFRVSPPSENTARLRAEIEPSRGFARLGSELTSEEVSKCEELLTLARTYFSTN